MNDQIVGMLTEIMGKLDKQSEKIAWLSDELVKMNVLLENEVDRKIGVIFEKLEQMDARLAVLPDEEEEQLTKNRLEVLEVAVKRVNREVLELKRA